MPIIIFCYAIINLSFFAVLSVGEIVDSTAVALVCTCMYVNICVCMIGKINSLCVYIQYLYEHDTYMHIKSLMVKSER